MVRKSHGPRRRTREKLRKSEREKFTVTKYLRTFEPGERVVIVPDPSSKSIPFRRFHGRSGEIVEKRGRAYIVLVRDGRSYKKVIARPEHLRRL